MDDENNRTIFQARSWPVKRLAFKIRKRGFVAHNDTSLLISNSLGVWSLRRRRYVKKSRFQRFYQLRAEALPAETLYAKLRSLGMHSWPEYDEQVATLRSRLVDMYWDAAPAWYRVAVVNYYREASQWPVWKWWPIRFILAPISLVTVVDMSFHFVKEASSYKYKPVPLLLFAVVFYTIEVIAWCAMLFKPDASVLKMLEVVDKEYVNVIKEE